MRRIVLIHFLLGMAVFGQRIVPPATLHWRTATSSEDIEWDSVRKSSDLDRWYNFASRYPRGRHHNEAAQRIATLEQQARELGEPVNGVLAAGPEYTLVVDDSSKGHGFVVKAVPK